MYSEKLRNRRIVVAKKVRDRNSHTELNLFSKIQLVVYHQCCVLIGWATTRLYVIAH